MRKVLVYFCVGLLLSCSNSFIKEEEKEYIPSTYHERAILGYDLDVVHEKEVNIKVFAKDEAELDSILASLEEIGVEKRDLQDAFVDGEYFINAKVLGNYPETLKKVRKMNYVVYANPNYKVFLTDGWMRSPSDAIMKPFSLEEGNLDSDPIADQKGYSLAITEALRAYQEFGIGEHKVWAGIVDTGTNGNHEDMRHPDGTKVVQVLKDYGTHGLEDVETGNSDWETDGGGHGTHCSGVICAVGNNGKGISGVAWKNVMLASYKGLSKMAGDIHTIFGSLKDLVKTVRDEKGATQEKQATIPINLSLGLPFTTGEELEYINYAMKKGALLVAANGNEGQMLASYPAAFPGVLSVGATGGNDRKIGFSTTGPWINVCAPGVDIISLSHVSNTGYVYMSGTSMATPFVTGLVAYLLTFDPTLKPMQVIALLEKTADKVDATNRDPLAKYDAKGFSRWYGYGRVNVYRAAKAIKENKVPTAGDVYVETQLIVQVSAPNLPIYVYDKNTGTLVTVTVSTGDSPQASIRGLRPGTYKVICQGTSREAKITNSKDTKIRF